MCTSEEHPQEGQAVVRTSMWASRNLNSYSCLPQISCVGLNVASRCLPKYSGDNSTALPYRVAEVNVC